MPGWLSRLAIAVISILAMATAGGVVLGAACARTPAIELLATCLSCGEQWLFTPSATVAAGFLSLFARRRKPLDKCPKCGSRAVTFGHAPQHGDANQRRTS
jgi:hypothetical protein